MERGASGRLDSGGGMHTLKREVYEKQVTVHVKRSLQLRQENTCRIGTETPVFAEDVGQGWRFTTRNVQ